MKEILVPITGTAREAERVSLTVALGLLKALGGRLRALHVRPDPRDALPMVGDGMPVELIERMIALAEESAAEDRQAARKLYEEMRASSGIEADPRVQVTWQERVGHPEWIVPHEARLADLTVFPHGLRDSLRLVVEETAFGSGRPVFVAQGGTGEKFASAVIAWDGSIPAVRAVASAVPLLERTERVTILTILEDRVLVNDPERLQEYLGVHGIAASIASMEPGERSVADALLAEAVELGAELLVMGAYGHTRFREMVLGGVTRRVLAGPTNCSVLMAH